MCVAEEFHDLGHGLFEWSAYDRTVKVDLHAHALVVANRLEWIDPVALRPEVRAELLEVARLAGGPGATQGGDVWLTNGNHARAAGAFRTRGGAGDPMKVRAADEAREALREDGLEVDGPATGGPFEVIPLAGFGPGEVAYFHPENGGTLFVGDALINLPVPFGFSVLPEKYCSEPRAARESLRRLLDVEFTRLLFAHGTPLVAGARAKLAALLTDTSKP